MKKVCIQAGHMGVTTGATGAPGERDWTSKIVPIIADKLKDKVEVYVCGGRADTDSVVTDTDWDLFLAVHYDADIYNDRGGFYDYPDKSVDQVYETSKQLATTIGEHYFKTTGIPLRLQRSNANTKFYYMWSALTAKTPCVIIECGVGNRKPEDYNILRDYDLISETLSNGILMSLGLYSDLENELAECQAECQKLDEELDDMRESRDKWKAEAKKCESECATKEANYISQIESLQKTNSELTVQLGLIAREKETALKERDNYKKMYEEIKDCPAKVKELENKIKEIKATTKKWWEFWKKL